MAETTEADAIAHGMTLATHIASGILIAPAMLEKMTSSHAAECMRTMIVSAIRAQAEAMQQSEWERERDTKETAR